MIGEEDDVHTAIQYTQEDLEFIESNTKTAVSIEEKDYIGDMGKRAKARKRAAKLANQSLEITNDGIQEQEQNEDGKENDGSIETNCEVPSNPSSRPSRIPILQKGYISSHSSSSNTNVSTASTGSNKSKIPRPTVVYLNNINNNNNSYSDCSTTDSQLSYTGGTASFPTEDLVSAKDDGNTCRDWVTPLPKCDISTESETLTVDRIKSEKFKIYAEANGVEVKLDLSAFIGDNNIELCDIRIK